MQTATTLTDRTRRLRRLIITLSGLLAAGLLYTGIVLKFHVGICCPFERLTGLQCPGCGISGMFLNMLQGDFEEAFRCNPVTFCMMPALLALAGYLMYRYVSFGDQKIPKWMNTALIAVAVLYLIWGVIRN
ncbi:MAG: DUF2752 domain-containing protein, partial [Lentihominibacter sp.]